jgi:myo-inositol-1(or 4)-monophosphatase
MEWHGITMTEPSKDDQVQDSSPSLLAEAQGIAEAASREAGAYLLAHQGTTQVTRIKAERDEQLDTDLEAERIILERLRATFPTFGILSEEAGLMKGESAYKWIVDPLDGSANYQHGSPLYGVMLALQRRRTVELGVIYLPVFDELFVAKRHATPTVNGKPISVSDVTHPHRAVLHYGDFAKTGSTDITQYGIDVLRRLADTVGRVRMIGSAAVDFAWLACGRADALIMFDAQLWDRVAGELLVSQAGGVVRHRSGALGLSVTTGSNGDLFDHMLQAVAQPGAHKNEQV